MTSISYAARSIRPSVVQAATVLACFAGGLALDHFEQLGPSIVVLTVVLGLNLGRTQRYGGAAQRLSSLAALPAVAVACNEVGRLFVQHADWADVLFTAAVGLSIWMRRFGPNAARLGTLIALPFISLLVVPVPVVPGSTPSAGRSMLWSAVAAVIAYCWVWIMQEAGERAGFVEALPRSPGPQRGTQAAAAKASGAESKKGLARIPASSRMAAQMTLSLALAFVIGRAVFGPHWEWIVLTAFIVNSGNRGRGDVLHKSLLRVVGAGAGTVVATLLAGILPARDDTGVVIILAVLMVASWLRTLSYVYWAGCVTSVLSLLQGYFGENHVGLIGERLLQIVLGGVLAVAVAWFVLPVRSADVVRRRLADSLAAVTALLSACLREPESAGEREREFAERLVLLEEVAPSIRAHRRLHRLRGLATDHPADAIDAIRGCASAAGELAQAASQSPEQLRAPGVPALAKAVTGNVTAARKAIGRRPADAHTNTNTNANANTNANTNANFRAVPIPATGGPATGAPATGLTEALLHIDTAMQTICAVYRPERNDVERAHDDAGRVVAGQ